MIDDASEALILQLLHTPQRPVPTVTGQDILDHYNVTDGKALGLRLLNEAIAERDGSGVELSLMVAHQFGFDLDYSNQMNRLAFADWHNRHEDIATILGRFRNASTLDALRHLTSWIPDYLDGDEFRVLARKAVYAMEYVPGDDAVEALRELTTDPDPLVAEFARRTLARRLESESEH